LATLELDPQAPVVNTALRAERHRHGNPSITQIDAAKLGEGDAPGNYFPAFPRCDRGSPRDAAFGNTRDVDVDASWENFSVAGALSSLRRILCDHTVRGSGLGGSSRRANWVET
jgi:hypothetical protein